MIKKLLALAFSVFVISACQMDAPNIYKTVSSGSGNVNSSSNAAAIKSSDVKTAQSTGVVTKINLEAGSVELDHDEIKGMMPAMQMEFNVADRKELKPLKIGDKVAFTLEDNKGRETITKIAKHE